MRPLRSSRARPALSREAIVEAAIRVLDSEGAQSLSMRRVAEELGCGVGALYWHVESKEQLVQLVFDRVIDEIPQPEPDPKRWREQVKQSAREVRSLMQRHPGLAQLSMGNIPLGPNAIRHHEWYLSLLRAGGLSDRVAALAGDLVFLYVGAFGVEECHHAPPPGPESKSFEDFVGEMRDYFASLPPERFPNLTELADELTLPGPDERFEFGLDVLIDGLLAQSGAPSR
jgi:AcrR family transcriptional regulator